MKRKELIQQFNIKGTFLNQLLTRADILKDFKVGTGYASEYDPKTTFLILLGWEMHQLGISFRHIDDVLSSLASLSTSRIVKEMGDGAVAIYPKKREELFEELPTKTTKFSRVSWGNPKNLWKKWNDVHSNSNTAHMGAGVMFIDTSSLWSRIE